LAYLVADSLPAVFALDLMLDDRVMRQPLISDCKEVKGNANAKKIDAAVDEISVVLVSLVPFRRSKLITSGSHP
jgi:hypothetical protein